MAKDNIQPDVLRSAEATPIAKLSPTIADAAALVVEGVVTVTWPYSVVSKSIAFILAERDPLHRRDKGQLRVEFHGAAGKALAASSLGGGDEVRLSLDGVAWEENQAWTRHPGILEWQLRFCNRLLLKIRRADTLAVDTIDIDAADEEEDQEPLQQLREPSPTPSIEIERTQFSTPLPRTPLSTIPSKRFAYESLGPGEYSSPAFIKRARVSYGSLFEGGFDIFDEEEPVKDVKKKKKKKKKSRFSMNPTAWRYTSRSPSPEEEQEQADEEAEEAELKLDDVEEPVAEEQRITQTQPVMVDHGCQTRELSSSPIRGVQVIAESRSTGILLQPTPTHPWKHVGVDHVLQEPSPLSFDYAVVQDVHHSIHESESPSQSEMHLPHAGFDIPMDIDPSLQPHEGDAHHHPTYDIKASEIQPPQLQEHGPHDAHLHDLAWAAEALAPGYPAVPTHRTHDFQQGSFDRSTFTLRASPSDETHTLVSAGHHGAEMHGYVQIDEARRASSSSYVQQDGVKPNNSYPERYEEDTETATVTATLAPAVPKEPIFISLLSDSEDDGDNAPAPIQAKKEPSEEPALHEQDEVHEQTSEQEDDVVDELVDEDVDETMDEDMDEAEDKSDIEEATEIRTVASRSSRRSSRISQLDGCDEDTLYQDEEPNRGDVSHAEMDHPNLIISPKAYKTQQHVDITETLAQAQEESPMVSSPLQRMSSGQHELAAANTAKGEEIPTVEMRGASESPAPEPISVEAPAVVEPNDEMPAVEQKQLEQTQRAESLGIVNSTEQLDEPSLQTPDVPAEMTDVAETPTQQPIASDDLHMEDLQPTTLEVQPPNAGEEAEVNVTEHDVEMQDDALYQLSEETEIAAKEDDKEVDQTTTDIVSKATGEPEVAAPSSPPATQTEPSHSVSMAVAILEEQEITEKQLPTPLETQQDDYENSPNVVDVAHVEVPPNEEGVNEGIEEGVEEGVEEDVEDEYKDADENMDEEYEDAREEGGDDDDLAIEQQLMSEFQHYSTPRRRAMQTALGRLSRNPLTRWRKLKRANKVNKPNNIANIAITGNTAAMTTASTTTESTNEILAEQTQRSKGSPTMAHRQCLLGDSDYLPQRSPRSPRNKAEHSDPSIALAKSSPRNSVSPKDAGASVSLRARRGVKGSIDASILLAQSFSPPSERSPASPTASLRAGRRKSDKSDLSVQLATASLNKVSQQQQVAEEGEQENALDAAQDASANPRRDGTPEPTVTGHNLRSPRKPAAVPSTKTPSVASSVAEDGNMTSLKLQLLKSLRTTLPDCLPLKSLRTSLTKTADILAVATLTPRQPHRPKHGPRDYMLELYLTDPSVAPTGVNIAHIFRPHQASLPIVQAGDIVLLRRVQVVSMQGRGFGIRAGDASAWAVFEKDDDEMLPQIKGPPVEVTDEEVAYVQGLRRWWGLQDDKTLAKIDKANHKMSQAVKDDAR
ncbi:hypothetical protein TrVFT333_011280 [Trichoderma virens FT-333]|nr:hypothetical protein TrVFT333_011280 [Trichoderma virens FT-333]